jgi:hypothetical protein
MMFRYWNKGKARLYANGFARRTILILTAAFSPRVEG